MNAEEIHEILLGLIAALPATVDNVHIHLHLEGIEVVEEPEEPEEPQEPQTTMTMVVLDPDNNGRERLYSIQGWNDATPKRPIVLPANYANGNPIFILPGERVQVFLTEGVDGVIAADGGGRYYMIATGTTSSGAYPNASGYLLPVEVLRIFD